MGDKKSVARTSFLPVSPGILLLRYQMALIVESE
jgi:hypothetical protein